MRRYLRMPIDDVLDALEPVARAGRPRVALMLTVLAMVVVWFAYVPVHELLHAVGCRLTGGTVSRLEIAPAYGGTLLARRCSWITAGGTYAGRLSGFETHGSDAVYLATCFAPFLLSIFPGVWILRRCANRPRPILLGAGVVLGLAPFYNLPGDYYEMGSILVTRALTILSPQPSGLNEPSPATAHRTSRNPPTAPSRASDAPVKDPGGDGEPVPTASESQEKSEPPIDPPHSTNLNGARFASIRSDDLVRLVGDWARRPERLGLSSARERLAAGVAMFASLLLGMVLAWSTYLLGRGIPAAPQRSTRPERPAP